MAFILLKFMGMMVIRRCRVKREVMGLTMIRMGIISMAVEGTKDFAAMGGLAIPTVQNGSTLKNSKN